MSFFEIFNPGARHQREEQDRQKMLVSKPTYGGGAPLGIDLDGGTAKITIQTRSRPEPVDDESEVDESTDQTTGLDTGSDPDETGAQVAEEFTGAAEHQPGPADRAGTNRADPA